MKFSHTGGLLRWIASCKFEQIPDEHVVQESVRRTPGDVRRRRRRARKEPPLDLESLKDITARKRGGGASGEWEPERVRINPKTGGASGSY